LRWGDTVELTVGHPEVLVDLTDQQEPARSGQQVEDQDAERITEGTEPRRPRLRRARATRVAMIDDYRSDRPGNIGFG
jgi:hypothetical protein